MNAQGQTVSLCMIVKNEAAVIRHCLDSVRAIIDHWVIVDTGSTDGTQDIVRDHLNGLNGGLYERPWQDFAHNRSEALALARPHADYSLIIDADDVLEYPAGFNLPPLTADSYSFEIHHGSVVFRRPQMVRNALPFQYKGVVHEFLTCDAAGASGHLPIRIRQGNGGARRRDPETYRRDAAILERALEAETDPFMTARYTFYLAQSYLDSGQKDKAIEAYLRRADMGHWDQEVFIALYRVAQLKEGLGHDREEVLETYRRASDACPFRAEASHGASRLCFRTGDNKRGYKIAKAAINLTAPEGGLFVEQWIYDYGLLDEFSINAYWAGAYGESLEACFRLLASDKLPQSERPRVLANARFALGKVGEGQANALATMPASGRHAMAQPRQLRSRVSEAPRVLLAILAKQKEASLPLYLECIEALDYPKSSIVLYVRTNNNTDKTEAFLREWVTRVGHLYGGVEFDAENVEAPVERFGEHEWNVTRFRVLGKIRNESLRAAVRHTCDFYFVADVDNYLRPCTLKELAALDLPVVAPLLRSVAPDNPYSNYHADIDENGYYRESALYRWALHGAVSGVLEMPVVHCCYLIRADVLGELTYEDGSDRFEYVVFSDSARKSGIPQYLDNRQVYGYITFGDGPQHLSDGIERARALLAGQASSAGERPPAFSNAAPQATMPEMARSLRPQDAVTASAKETFGDIYGKNRWGYGSGVGSLPINNVEYLEFLHRFLKLNGIESVVDLGCGDWQFSQLINWASASYLGLDVVPEVIEQNRLRFASPRVSFDVFRALDQIPAADLLLCKDVLQHLPNATISEYLAVFKRKFKFLLITNDDQPEDQLNADVEVGGWRAIRLDRAPFCETAPVVLSWPVLWGGWRPTRKSTQLILGQRV